MTACMTDSTLEMTLKDGVLMDNKGRTGYIVSPLSRRNVLRQLTFSGRELPIPIRRPRADRRNLHRRLVRLLRRCIGSRPR